MKIAYSLIKKFLNSSETVDELADILTLLGIETEEIIDRKAPFLGVVAAQIVQLAPHPSKKHLVALKVSTGNKTFSVVCGDTTLQLHDKVAYAMVGSSLAILKDPLQKRDFGGVLSEGMLCSEYELQLGLEKSQVIRLDDSFALGADIAQKVHSPIFNIALTPNLGHCQSAYGLARELGAFLNKPIKPYKEIFGIATTPDLCLQYSLLEVKNVKVKSSPLWLQWSLRKMGFKPINNVVDAIHYVTLLYGQPMHAFDKAKIKGDLQVKLSETATKVCCLDDVERVVPPGSLTIMDMEKIVALAGIMGEKNSAVAETTTDILIEIASFNPKEIRKTAQKTTIRSESSARFERGVDPNLVHVVARTLTALLNRVIPTAQILPLKTLIKKRGERVISLNPKNIERVYGAPIELSFAEQILKNLHFKLTKDGENYQVKIPTSRNDVVAEIDLIKDIIRHRGLDANRPFEKPYLASNIPDDPKYLLQKKARSKLLAFRLQEVLTPTLISKESKSILKMMGFSPLAVLHTKSQEYNILRPTHLVSLLQAVKKNSGRSVSFFELGMVHHKKDPIEEHLVASIILSDYQKRVTWHKNGSVRDFFELKGYIEEFFHTFHKKATFIKSDKEYMHPFCQAQIALGSDIIGICGQVAPKVLDLFDLKMPLFFAEFALDKFTIGDHKFEAIAKTPSSERDWTVTVAEKLPFEAMERAIERFRSPLLEKYRLLDIFRSDSVGKNKKNITIRFTYRDKRTTLLNNEVDSLHDELCKNVQNRIDA